MAWSPQQDSALSAVAKWYNSGADRSPCFKLFGWAGTGKTTLAKHFAAGVDGEVLFGAYTGKAASVLRSKGCDNAATIHQLIYRPQSKSKAKLRDLEAALVELYEKIGAPADGEPETRAKPTKLLQEVEAERRFLRQPQFALNESGGSLTADTALLIIDECSMVDKKMADDLLSFSVPILVLGDPAQLPPVHGGGAFTSGSGDFMLTEIHRQAEGNPIIELATRVRKGQSLALGKYGSSSVIHRSQVDKDAALSHDQIIVGKNATRHKINKLARIWNGLDVAAPPVVGEKLVCLRNDHDLGLLNGTLWKVEKTALHGINAWDADARLVMSVSEFGVTNPSQIPNIIAFSDTFYDQGGNRTWFERKEAQEFDYGYALTCHKAQGSQWGSVLIRDESGAFRGSSKEWLYTAITRAVDTVTVAID